MATLPYSRVVDVNLTRLDNFPSRQGFGVPLILSNIVSDVVAGAVDATTPTKVYGSLDEVAVDWSAATEAYLIAQSIFSQSPTPTQVKIGFTDGTAAGMDTLEAFDAGWYQIVSAPAFTDAQDLILAAWVETRNKIAFMLTNDANIENPADATNLAAQLKALNYRRSGVFYTINATEMLHADVAAYIATRNFDDAESAYTAKFKSFNGIPVLDRGSAAVQAITGFVPGVGMDATQGHFANAYVDIGGAQILVEGTMADGRFIDEIHFEDWIIARTQEELLGVFTTNARIPYTDKGINLLVQGVQRVLSRARSAGAIAAFDNAEGNIVDWEISVARVIDVPAAQRSQRIAPTISALFRYAGAVHWTRVDYTMSF